MHSKRPAKLALELGVMYGQHKDDMKLSKILSNQVSKLFACVLFAGFFYLLNQLGVDMNNIRLAMYIFAVCFIIWSILSIVYSFYRIIISNKRSREASRKAEESLEKLENLLGEQHNK